MSREIEAWVYRSNGGRGPMEATVDDYGYLSIPGGRFRQIAHMRRRKIGSKRPGVPFTMSLEALRQGWTGWRVVKQSALAAAGREGG